MHLDRTGLCPRADTIGQEGDELNSCIGRVQGLAGWVLSWRALSRGEPPSQNVGIKRSNKAALHLVLLSVFVGDSDGWEQLCL